MIKTTFICDRCGTEYAQKEGGHGMEFEQQPVCVGMYFNFGQTYPPPQSHNISQAWCRPCVMKMGIREPITKEDKEVSPEVQLSFDEKVVILLEELGFSRNI